MIKAKIQVKDGNYVSMHSTGTSFHLPSGHFTNPFEFQFAIPRPTGAQGTRGEVQVLPERIGRNTSL